MSESYCFDNKRPMSAKTYGGIQVYSNKKFSSSGCTTKEPPGMR